VALTVGLCSFLCILLWHHQVLQGGRDLGGGCSHLNMEAQPAEDQTECTMTGYTQAAMKKE
jgi:hypothetical protein